MTYQQHAAHWEKLALRDWKTSCGLFEIKRYDACLFFCHLTLEKFLKGLVTLHTKQHPPYIHDLERLAVMANITLVSNEIIDLKNISAFNIAGRYSDYKFVFYKKCTRAYTEKYLLKTKHLMICLKKLYPKH